MNRQEFVAKTGATDITDCQWNTLHTVYQFHPAIPDVGGQDKIAALWLLGGFGLMQEMEPTAQRCETIENVIENARREMEDAQARLADIKAQYTPKVKGGAK